VAKGKKWLIEQLDYRGISYVGGHANFVLIDCGERCLDIAEALKRDNILVGAGFKQPFLKKYFRVTLAGPEVMKRFWDVFTLLSLKKQLVR